MATRLYLDSGAAAAVAPAYTPSWDITTDADRLVCSISPSDNDLQTGSQYAELDSATVNVLAHQYVSSEQIPSDRTISGTVAAVIGCRQTNTGSDGFLQLVVKVVSADGSTVRGTLYAGSALNTVSTTVGDINEEMSVGASALQTRIVPTQTVGSVNAQTGDRIVLEFGWRATNTTNVSRGAFFRHGYETALGDHSHTSNVAITEASTNDFNPWVELSSDVFEAPVGNGEFESIGNGVLIASFGGTAIDEASGMVESRAHPGYLYVHNDSDTGRVFMVDINDGSVDATLTVTGSSQVDWEDAAFYNGAIYVADIGNNAGTRTNQKIVKFNEPASVASGNVAATEYPVSFTTGGTLDMEAFMIRPTDGATFIYLKANASVAGSGLFQGPNVSALSTSGTNEFTKILNHSLHQVTAGDYAESGEYYVLNTNGTDPTFDTYGGMYVYDGVTHVEVGRKQGHKTQPLHPSETICWSVDGAYLYRSYDGGGTTGMPIYRYPVNYTTAGGGSISANAGVDQTGARGLTVVTLTGTATNGTGGYVHSWVQTGGPSVTLSGTGASRNFRAPATLSPSGETLTFNYTVDDGTSSANDTVVVSTLPHPYWYASASSLLKPYNLASSTDGGDDLPLLSTVSSTTFKSYFGTRIFPSYNGKTGGELVTDHSWLTNLGIKWVSHRLTPTIAGDTDIINLMQDLGAEGTKSVLTIGEPFTAYSGAEWTTMMDALKGPLAGCVLMVTGQNEINHVRGGGALPSDWKEQARDHQMELWDRMNGGAGSVNDVLTGNGHPQVLVGNPNLWSGNISVHDADLADFAPMVKDYADAIAYHLYPRGGHPTWNLNHFITEYKAAYGSSRPIWCTEAGYFSAANYTGGSKDVTLWAHDIYLRKLWLEYAIRGCYVSQFEFLDDPDPTNSQREANFGLVETPSVSVASWTAKPAYTNLASMLNGMTGGTTGTVHCEITTSGNVQRLAVNHSTGTRLFLWRQSNIESDLQPISLTPVQVTVRTATQTQNVNVTADVVVVDL